MAQQKRSQPLPRLAQASPGFGVALTEINGDAYCDLYLVQNFFGPQVETGRMDGGIGVLLLGQGDGSFVPVPADQSGLVVPGDAKALAVTDINGDSQPDMLVARNDDRQDVRMAIFQVSMHRRGRVLFARMRTCREPERAAVERGAMACQRPLVRRQGRRRVFEVADAVDRGCLQPPQPFGLLFRLGKAKDEFPQQ